MPDRDGYPTDSELAQIAEWPDDDPVGWFAFIRGCWWAADWGWTEQPGEDGTHYDISTGGWSGNEEIIETMRAHPLWWRYWEQTRRGGHYRFVVPGRAARGEEETK